MSSKPAADPMQRLNALRTLLQAGQISTQEELANELKAQQFVVTQSTISRDLSRLGAVKARDASGRIVYKLPEDVPSATAMPTSDFKGLLVNVTHNGSLIVILTTPGSASLVAHQLDKNKPEGILGTIAGDDTIFVAPRSLKSIDQTIQAIMDEFS